MIDKRVLEQYIDTVKEIDEIKLKIGRLERKLQQLEDDGTVIDSVSGGEGGTRHYKVEGIPLPAYSKTKTALHLRKSTLENLMAELEMQKAEVEAFVSTIEDSQMRRIIRFRFFERMPWKYVAAKIGGGNTEDGVKKAFQRFMKD